MTNPPASIAIMMDGNRRYAKAHGLPSLEGHRAGFAKAKEVVEWTFDAGIREVILYAFSTENWNRSPEESSYLMNLFQEALSTWAEDVAAGDGRLRIIGQRERFPQNFQDMMNSLEERTKDAKGGTLAIALSYGGRAEIVATVNKLLASGVSSVDEASFEGALWSAGLKDPDLIIRTGGNKRLSNFLPWQSVYSELVFTDTFWPALTKEEFTKILDEFASRDRRFGR